MSYPPICPTCEEELVYVFYDCGDDDPYCECDEAMDCPRCGARWMNACGAHINVKWTDRVVLS